jgi:LruC domain-containing protein
MEFALAAGYTPGANYFKSISNGVSFVEKPTLTIPSTSCNEGGVNADNGSGNPSNPTFPIVVAESNSYTFAMEDLWPNLGDYDMNDFVFSLKNIKKTINAENKVLRLEFDVVPRGAGSTKKLAAAVQFDNIQRSNISVNSTNSVAKIESDLTLANIRLFDDVHGLFGKSNPVIINTYERFAPVNTQTYTFTFDFATPVSASDVIVSALNFYVIVGDADVANRKEIHLAGYKPTTKVTRETNNYKDTNNMIWALMLPTADFKYPTESTRIFNAYGAFNSWAASAGRVDADWYLKPSATEGLVYTKY